METDAAGVFEAGLAKAEEAYADAFEEAKGGIGTWLTTWGDDWDEHIASSLRTARARYMEVVDEAIDEVATLVDNQLNAAKLRVQEGLQEVQTFVDSLDESVKQFGTEAMESVAGDFEAMSNSINERRDGLIQNLTQQYRDSHQRMSAMEEQLRAENRSLWSRVYDATVGLVQKILEIKNQLLSILGRASAVIKDIVAHPIRFLSNLVAGIMQGLRGFLSKLDTYLVKGLMGWLFGALAGAGLTLPDKFDLKGIIGLVLQILGITYANFRARAVRIVGEPVVNAIETTAEVFMTIAREGAAGLWRFIQEQLANLKAMVLDAIFNFVKERVIIAGITWIIGLLNPASAFFKACKAIYDIVMFFVQRGRQIMELVNAVVNSLTAIASGAIGGAAAYVENALAKTIPVAIGFLASLLGLGDPSAPIRGFIERARAPVNRAIDWVINLAVRGVRAVGTFATRIGVPSDPDERLRLGKQAAMNAVNRFSGRRVSMLVLKPILGAIKVRYGFSRLEVIPDRGKWRLHGEINPKFDEATESLTPESLAPGSNEDTLEVGGGNFTFALAIAAKTKIGGRLVSTDFLVDERKSLAQSNSEQSRNEIVNSNIEKLKQMGVEVERQVDATDPSSYPSGEFDTIVFNHPLVLTRVEGRTQRGGESANIELVTGFLSAAKQKIKENGKIVLISSRYRLQRWKLDEIAEKMDLSYEIQNFLVSDFPGYAHEKTESQAGAKTLQTREQFAIIFSIKVSRNG